ncbi:MAG: hypothetical protein ACKVRN_16530 [Pyrinomonadaceae bacterium]
MNVVETIWEKVFHLPPNAQEEVLRQVEQIAERYLDNGLPVASNGSDGNFERDMAAFAESEESQIPSVYEGSYSREDIYSDHD